MGCGEDGTAGIAQGATDKMDWTEKRLKYFEEITYASLDNIRRLEGRVSLLEAKEDRRNGATETTLFDVVKQLDLDIFSESIYMIAGMSKSEAEFRARLQEKMSEKVLQQLNRAAQVDGIQPLSFSDKQ